MSNVGLCFSCFRSSVEYSLLVSLRHMPFSTAVVKLLGNWQASSEKHFSHILNMTSHVKEGLQLPMVLPAEVTGLMAPGIPC